MTVDTSFLSEAELSDTWPEAIAVVVATGTDETGWDQLSSAAFALAGEHEQWGKAWMSYRSGEHAGERWATIILTTDRLYDGIDCD